MRETMQPRVRSHLPNHIISSDSCVQGYHAAGTCAMGKADNPAAVVDEKLAVRGVQNLRVADCSIMPTLHGGHTQMPAYGIGEKCADLIKARWDLN